MKTPININFIRDFESKEEVQHFIEELKCELKVAHKRLASIYFCTDPEKICPKNKDVFEWMHDEFDKNVKKIQSLSIRIDECEQLLNQWDEVIKLNKNNETTFEIPCAYYDEYQNYKYNDSYKTIICD